MVKLLLICLATIVMISCGSEQEKLTVYIPDTCTDTLQYEIYLPEEEGLNIFYDLCVTDSFCAFLDTRNDTLLKIFTATIPPALVGLGMKGEGPDDFLFPFFEKSIGREGKGKLSFIELNSWNKKIVAIHSAASPAPVAVSVVEAQQLPEMPVVRDYNETDSCVYGIDVDMQHGLFFIYDKHTARVKTVDYHRDIRSGYPEGHLSYLYKVTTKKRNAERYSDRIELQGFQSCFRLFVKPSQSPLKPNQDAATLLVRNHARNGDKRTRITKQGVKD